MTLYLYVCVPTSRCVSASLCVCVCVYSQQVLGVDGVNFSVHVENQTQVRDTMSRRHHRVYQLYSRTSGKHVQVLGRRISARGEDGDKYGKTHTHSRTQVFGTCECMHSWMLTCTHMHARTK